MEHGFGLDIPETLAELCTPQRLALIVYDMQVGIVPQIPDGEAVAARVGRVLAAARDGGYRVFFTRHMSLPNEVAGVSQLHMAMAWQRKARVADVRPSFLRDSRQFQIVPALTPRPSEAVFDKIAMSAFSGTPLDLALRDAGILAFAIVGIALEIGIESRGTSARPPTTVRCARPGSAAGSWSSRATAVRRWLPRSGVTRRPAPSRG